MKRRTFILLSGVNTLSLAIPWVGCQSRVSDLDRVLSQPRFLAHIWDESEIHNIGLAYRKLVPDEAGETQLAMLLLAETTGKSISVTIESSSLGSWLERKIVNDFKIGQTVVVKGWVLSVTEARQCAVYSLMRP
jgi:hypothetical protein